jgi:hypothetical protein
MNREQDPSRFNQLLLEAAKYHIHNHDLTEFGESGEYVSSFLLPTRTEADELVQSYFTTVHQLFPILLGPVFIAQYELFWQTSQPPPNTALWVAILNLVFALGAIYGHFIQAGRVNNERDHLLYFVRARLLSLEHLAMLQVPTMENIQLTSLFGMYLVASCQINK